MKKVIRFLIVLVIGIVIGAGGFKLYSGFKAGAEIAEDEETPDLSDSEIRDGIRSANIKTRLTAVAQIEKLSDDDCRAALLDALKAPYATTRLTAVTTMGKRLPTDPKVVEALMDSVKSDPDDDVRLAACGALEKSGHAGVLDIAYEVLESDAGPGLKLGAVQTLDRLTGRSTAADLEGYLKQAEGAGDDLLMDWDDWLGENRDKLTWDAETGRFVTGS